MTSVLIKRREWDTDSEGWPCKDRGKGWPSTSQGERPWKKQACRHLDAWLLVSISMRKISVVEPPSCGTLLWQPWKFDILIFLTILRYKINYFFYNQRCIFSGYCYRTPSKLLCFSEDLLVLLLPYECRCPTHRKSK